MLDPDAAEPPGAPGPPASLPERDLVLLAVIAVGAVIGAQARYSVGLLLPHRPATFPWATLLINVSGGFGIGVLMAVLARLGHPHRLLRPFVGIGVLGGFTTFSTYSVDTYRLIDAGRPFIALSYAGLTLLAALAATVAGGAVVQAVPRRPGEGDAC